MIRRTLPDDLEAVAKRFPEYFKDFDVSDFIDNGGFALIDGEDVGLFEVRNGVYYSHIFFTSRGIKAYRKAVEMLQSVLKDMKFVIGLTPVGHPSLGLAKKLGFEIYEDVDTPDGVCTLSVLTWDSFMRNNQWAF